MASREVELAICPSYWCFGDAGTGLRHDSLSEEKLVDSLCIGRAFENEIILAYCNAAGTLKLNNYTDTLLGHSQITMPFKGCVRKIERDKEEMLVHEIDTTLLQDAEYVYGLRKERQKR